MAGAVYRLRPDEHLRRQWPAYWNGKPFLAEWNKNTLFSILTNAAMTKPEKVTPTTLHKLPAPATRTIKMMDSKFGPDGSLYMIDWGSRLERATPTPASTASTTRPATARRSPRRQPTRPTATRRWTVAVLLGRLQRPGRRPA